MLSGQREACGLQLRLFPVCHSSKAPCSGALGEQQKPSWRFPGKAALEFCAKVDGDKEGDVLGGEGMFSVICTTGTVKSAPTGSWDFRVLYFRDPTFQIVTPTSVLNEGSKILEISESQMEPQRAISLKASPGGRY